MARYVPLILGTTGKPKCPDEYEPTSTRLCQRSSRLMIQVSKQAVFVQLGLMLDGQGSSLGSVEWQPEFPLLPMVASLGRNYDAVRVRNFTPGAEAQVFVTMD